MSRLSTGGRSASSPLDEAPVGARFGRNLRAMERGKEGVGAPAYV